MTRHSAAVVITVLLSPSGFLAQTAMVPNHTASAEPTITSADLTAKARFEKHYREPEATQGLRERHAPTATPAELARGKSVFMGAVSAASGGTSCASCHIARGYVATPGATFGGDLTHVYSRFQDGVLTTLLTQPCFRYIAGKDRAPVLNDDEAFTIKAFLWQVDRDAASGAKPLQ